MQQWSSASQTGCSLQPIRRPCEWVHCGVLSPLLTSQHEQPATASACSGVLYVYLDRAENLASSTAQGFTRNM